jgi:hypothetical protein
MKTKEKPKKTTMTSKEQHMNIIENQRKIYEQTKGKPMRTTEKSMKKQRRNNEKQWKTKGNFASILSYFWTFCPCCFEFFIFNGQRNKRQFWKKQETCLEASWRLNVHKTL